MCVLIWLANLNVGAFFSIVGIFYILCFLIILYTNEHDRSIGQGCALQALGPGFDSQVPHIFHNFSLKAFLCSVPSRLHHTPSCSGLTSGFMINPKARTWRLPYTLVNYSTCKLESQRRPCNLGPKLLYKNLQKGPDTPPCLYSFF